MANVGNFHSHSIVQARVSQWAPSGIKLNTATTTWPPAFSCRSETPNWFETGSQTATLALPHPPTTHHSSLSLTARLGSNLFPSILPSPHPSTPQSHSTKMAPVKKSKSAKSSESINSRLQLVVKSGKVRL